MARYTRWVVGASCGESAAREPAQQQFSGLSVPYQHRGLQPQDIKRSRDLILG